MWTGKTQMDGATGIAGHVEVVATSANRTRILLDDVQDFVPPLRIEVVKNNFPHAAAYICQAETVAAALAIMIHR